jgi:hypothetical protein
LTPTHTNYSPENQTNTRYSLGLSPHLDQQSFENSSSRKNKTSVAQMEKLGTCRNFFGYPHENGETFLNEFESFSTLHELDYEDDESRRLAAFHLHMKGSALTWYNGLQTNAETKWNDVKTLFIDKYVRVGWQHPSVLIENEIFHNLSLKPGQNIEDVYCLLIEKGQLLSKPEHEIMAQFIKVLPEKLAFYIRASKPNDTTEALTIAKTGEAYNYSEHDTTIAAATVTKSQSDDLADMKLQINQLTDVVKGLTFQCKNRPNENQGPVPKESPNFQQPRCTGTCFKCNATGHARRNCNWNGEGRPSTQSQCQLCSQFGHFATQCHSLKNVKKTNDIIQCQLCSKRGHSAKDCYSLQGNRNNLGVTGHDLPGGQ